MRIERISDNQIRCTLYRDDLAERNLNFNDMAHGSGNAKRLFRDMIQQANIDFGFSVDNNPLMIEAIPMSQDALVLVITKVKDNAEISEKFSRFGNIGNLDLSLKADDDEYEEDKEKGYVEYKNNMQDTVKGIEGFLQGDSEESFVPLHHLIKPSTNLMDEDEEEEEEVQEMKDYLFVFKSLDDAIDASHAILMEYFCDSSLWKDESSGEYYLVISGDNEDTLRRVCVLLGEYGIRKSISYATRNYFDEHFTPIIKGDAVDKLATI